MSKRPLWTLALVITELDRGGAERSLQRLALGLDRSRFRPVVVSLSGRGPVGDELSAAGVEVHAVEAGRRPLAAVPALVGLLRRLRPDLVHTFLFHANIAGRFAARAAGVRRVLSSIRVCEVDRPWRAAVDRLTHGLVDAETCVADAVRDYTRRAAGIPAGKLVVIRNGVPAADEAAPVCGRSRAATLAHLRPQKGVADLVAAAPAVLRRVPEASFVVAGRGDAGPYLRAARAAGVEAAFTFAGETDRPDDVLKSASLFVLPSRWEGCPNAVLEAMAAGLPVVATAVGGTPELVVHGETGLLVPAADPRALADAITALLADPARARAMGEAGRARLRREFGVERMVQAHEALYEGLLKA